jgi:ribosomal protein S18 acetylase RimI-like enzyme
MAETETLIRIEQVGALKGADRHDLCDAAEAAILDGGGFGWLKPPPRHVLEAFWQGVLLVPERSLFVGRLDEIIGGSAQLVRPTRNNEAQAHAATLTGAFVAPWARGHGMARGLVLAVEQAAHAEGFAIVNLDVRETQRAAIALYERLGYQRWGTHPYYAHVGGHWITGHFYSKVINPDLIAKGEGK